MRPGRVCRVPAGRILKRGLGLRVSDLGLGGLE